MAKRDPAPKWQAPFIIAFVGIRGVVSLAAALSIPLATATGQPFPERDMILAITFIVIVVTLVGQGLMMPWVLHWLRFPRDIARERRSEWDNEIVARIGAIHAAISSIDALAKQHKLSEDTVEALRHSYRSNLYELQHAQAGRHPTRQADELALEVIDAQRRQIHQALRDGKISDESRRRVERDLDLVETKLRHDYRVQFNAS